MYIPIVCSNSTSKFIKPKIQVDWQAELDAETIPIRRLIEETKTIRQAIEKQLTLTTPNFENAVEAFLTRD